MNFSYAQPYIVVGAFIVRAGNVLLIKENHLPDKGKWNIPAGKLDFGEDPLTGAVREVKEEAGLDFKPTAILGIHSVHRKDVPGDIATVHVLRIVFTGDVSGDVNYDSNEIENGVSEIADHTWLTPKQLANMESSELRYWDVRQYAEDYMAGKSYPLELIHHIVQEPL